MSARRPHSGIVAISASRNPEKTHAYELRPWSSPTIVGIAVDTIVPSIDARNMLEMTATVVRITRLRLRRDAYSVTA
jgi:hypothetical protein